MAGVPEALSGDARQKIFLSLSIDEYVYSATPANLNLALGLERDALLLHSNGHSECRQLNESGVPKQLLWSLELRLLSTSLGISRKIQDRSYKLRFCRRRAKGSGQTSRNRLRFL